MHASDIPQNDLVPDEPPPAQEDEALTLQLETEDRLGKIEEDLDRKDEQRLWKQLRSYTAMDLDEDEPKRRRSSRERKRKAVKQKEVVEEVETDSFGRRVKSVKYVIDSDVDV